MKVLICGSKDYNNWDEFYRVCIEILSKIQYERELRKEDIEIVEGGASGADSLAKMFSKKELGKSSTTFNAKWDDMSAFGAIEKIGKNGKPYNARAGFDQNQKMIEYLDEDDIMIAFHKNNSPGTADTIKRAKDNNIHSFIIKVK